MQVAGSQCRCITEQVTVLDSEDSSPQDPLTDCMEYVVRLRIAPLDSCHLPFFIHPGQRVSVSCDDRAMVCKEQGPLRGHGCSVSVIFYQPNYM